MRVWLVSGEIRWKALWRPTARAWLVSEPHANRACCFFTVALAAVEKSMLRAGLEGRCLSTTAVCRFADGSHRIASEL